MDVYSKYWCIHPTTSTSTKSTSELLEQDFAHYGYPHTIALDNATLYPSEEFQAWCRERGIIVHLTGAHTIPPPPPPTNGAATGSYCAQVRTRGVILLPSPPHTLLRESHQVSIGHSACVLGRRPDGCLLWVLRWSAPAV